MRTIRRPLSTVLLLTAVAVLAAGCQTRKVQLSPRASLDGFNVLAADPYEAGKARLAAGELGLAIQAFNAALVRDPGSVDVLNALGAAHDRLGRFDVAERYYRRALAQAPHDSGTLNNLGFSYLLQGRPDLAFALLEEARLAGGGNPVIAVNHRAAETALLRAREAREAGVRVAAAEAETATPATTQRTAMRDSGDPASEVPQAAPRPLIQVAALAPALAVAASPPPKAVRARLAVPERPAAPVAMAVEVSNGVGRNRMAARLAAYLRDQGVEVTRLTNARPFGHVRTAIQFRPGHEEQARAVAATLPVPVTPVPDPDLANPVRVRLGQDLLALDTRLAAAGTPDSSAQEETQ